MDFVAQSQVMTVTRPLEVEDALQRLSDIHAQVARGAHFRGYRAVPVAAMGGIAVLGALLESALMPGVSAAGHAWFWLGVAATCASIGALDMFLIRRRLQIRTVSIAVAQLVPTQVVGRVLGGLFADRAEMLPGVWTMVFGLGVLASRPYMPDAVLGVALFYISAGIAMAFAASDGTVPSPWEMGLTFGVGQLVIARTLQGIPDEEDRV